MKKIVIFLVLIVLLLVILLFRNDILGFLLQNKNGSTIDFFVKDIQKQILTPPPLRVEKDYQDSFLTRSGTIKATNFQRNINNLPSLSENNKLNMAA